jgi:two-component sensor histidine kinase
MIVNELVSNSLKYAFLNRETGEVQIKLFSEKAENSLNGNEEQISNEKIKYTLIVSDNGVGVPKIDFKNPDTLGLQLVNLLVDQLNGTIEVIIDKGTRFIIKFSTAEKL